jgi:spore coat polysaccharide biosynthesis protein SpsF (cytidylyltransferase family)
MELEGKPLLQLHLERLKRAKRINEIIVATTIKEEDARVSSLADRLNVMSFRGSENDVLDRFYQASKNLRADYIVRITSDCPLIDPDLIDLVVDRAVSERADYCSNVLIESFPDGQDVEVFTFRALEKAWREATLSSDREHVTPYIRKNCSFNGGSMFTAVNILADDAFGDIRLTVDEMADFEVIRDLITHLGTDKNWKDYAAHIRANKTIGNKNAHIVRNEGYTKSLKKEQNE